MVGHGKRREEFVEEEGKKKGKVGDERPGLGEIRRREMGERKRGDAKGRKSGKGRLLFSSRHFYLPPHFAIF